jgi:broad specificity phosphatase PhoE
VRRLLLVRHAATAATRRAEFPTDEPLDEHGVRDAGALASAVPSGCEVLASPARRCLQTAAAAGLSATVEPRLAECDFGSWAGRSLQEIHAERPGDAERWMTDPGADPHGGESLQAFNERVVGWLDEQRGGDGDLVAITHGGVVKAAVVNALDAPLRSFWRVGASPLAITELHAHGDGWTVTRVNCRRARTVA